MRVALISVHGCPLARLGEKDTGGMNVCVLETAKELGRRGIPVDVFTRYHEPEDLQVVPLGPNSRVVHLQAGPWHEGKLGIYQRLPEFTENLLLFQAQHGLEYDLIHSHYWLSGLVGARLALQWRVPHVATFHTLGKVKRLLRGGQREARQRLQKESLVVAQATRLVAGSPQEKDQLERLYSAPQEKVSVVPCGIDPELFRPIDKLVARAELGLADPKILLFVGRLEPIKGIDVLLRAAASLDGIDGLKVLVAGGTLDGGGEVARLRSLASELGLNGRVSFLGPLPQRALPLYYSAADVCVMPSYSESFGLVALEAMACQTPVVAARVGGLQSIIADGRTGYLVPGHCPDLYAERLELLLTNDVLRQRMGEAARASVQNLTWSEVVDRLVEVYALASDRAASGEPVACNGRRHVK